MRDNAKAFIDGGGVRLLVDLLTLSHLHVERAVTPLQSNLIEAGDLKRQNEREWYTTDAEKNKKGPYAPEELKDLFTTNKVRPLSLPFLLLIQIPNSPIRTRSTPKPSAGPKVWTAGAR